MPYTALAAIYDRLMAEDIDYDKLCDQIEHCFLRLPGVPHLIADLACGTGCITSRLAQRGYDMIGIDISEEMLNMAKKKDALSLYLEQDITEFELYGTVDAVLCMIDGYNYIISDRDLLKSFQLVKNYLNPGGLFLFDVSSYYKLSSLLGNDTFLYDDNSVFYAWENQFDEESAICSAYLTFFLKEKQLYRRFDEEHIEKARKPEEIICLLEKAGFSHIELFDETFQKPTETSQRVFFSSIVQKS